MYLLLILAAALPALWLIRHYVRHDAYPEPRGLIIKTALMGIVIIVPILIVELLLMFVIGEDAPHMLTVFLYAFVVAGFTEELFKYLVLKKYCSTKSDFDEPMDGIVYAVLVSLGFALLENIMYVLGAAQRSGARWSSGRLWNCCPEGLYCGAGACIIRCDHGLPFLQPAFWLCEKKALPDSASASHLVAWGL